MAQGSSGVGLGGLLTILFVGLKLTGYINWPWLWVLSPIWIPLAVIFGGLIIFVILARLFNLKLFS